MKRRQTSLPRQWLVADHRSGDSLWRTLRRLPRGSGVLVLYRDLPRPERSRLVSKLRRNGALRGLVIVDEAQGEAARVHDPVEIRQAALGRSKLLFLSPIYPTSSHPDWKRLPRMRAAALVRLANAPVVALGGMESKRFKSVAVLGFYGWAGIDAWSAGTCQNLRIRT
ncbi:MAG TPA: thiamine phosphate synthase [Sphingomicrobium sp.]|nr:thiamine phosphate synthase [Sphingomicrobium sp.]